MSIEIHEDGITISDSQGEIVSWNKDEWIEDPDVVFSIANAIKMVCGNYYGTHTLRRKLGWEIRETYIVSLHEFSEVDGNFNDKEIWHKDLGEVELHDAGVFAQNKADDYIREKGTDLQRKHRHARDEEFPFTIDIFENSEDGSIAAIHVLRKHEWVLARTKQD